MEYIEINSNGKVLRGMLHKGNASTDSLIPLIIIHGYFSANKIGPQRLFVRMANKIAKNRFDIYRFDLSGMGESDGEIDDIKFSDHIADVENIVKEIRAKYNKRVSVVSHCLGCNITLENVLKNSEWFREIIFLAPYYTTDDILSNLFDETSKKQLYEENYTYRKGLYAHKSFFEGSKQSVFIEKIKKVEVMINVVIPNKDQFISLEDNKKTFKGVEKVNLLYVNEADHNFLRHQEELINLVEGLLLDEKYTV